MKIRFWGSMAVLAAALASPPLAYVRAQSAPSPAKPAATADFPFDHHDFSGDWIGDPSGAGKRVSNNSRDQKIPEPPLTDWAKQHLLMKSISHDALDGTRLPGDNPNGPGPHFATDPNGVPANDPEGEYPGKGCEPLAAPAMYDYPQFGLLTFFVSPERIVMLNGYHHEWRIFWLNHEHPKDIDPTFEGDSVAKWDGDTLVVDTIGFNGKTPITQSVGHWKSDAFHLVERFTRVDHDHLVLDMTYYDPKAWGDKSWPGFRRYYRLVPIDQVHDRNYKSDPFSEWICSPADNSNFDKGITNLYKK